LYFVSGQRQLAAGKHRVHRLLLQRGLHGRQRRRLLRLPRRRLQGHLRCRARVLMFLARDQSVRQSPKSLLACSHVPRYHNSSGCWICARGIVCIKVFSMYELMQGLHTRACSPSMDVCIAGMDMSPCVLVLMIMPHQTPLYVNTCKQAAAPAPTVRRASTRQRREVAPVTIARPANSRHRRASISRATAARRANSRQRRASTPNAMTAAPANSRLRQVL